MTGSGDVDDRAGLVRCNVDDAPALAANAHDGARMEVAHGARSVHRPFHAKSGAISTIGRGSTRKLRRAQRAEV
jgi:hypothetical protein